SIKYFKVNLQNLSGVLLYSFKSTSANLRSKMQQLSAVLLIVLLVSTAYALSYRQRGGRRGHPVVEDETSYKLRYLLERKYQGDPVAPPLPEESEEAATPAGRGYQQPGGRPAAPHHRGYERRGPVGYQDHHRHGYGHPEREYYYYEDHDYYYR
ncbi:hypothetical protein BOX15_Mlig028422g1, partial [Macrostomum lignano]